MSAVLGLSAFFHDSAACLVKDGRIACAAEEERFSRRKHDDRFPARAAQACLADAELTAKDLDLVVYYELPFLHAERVMHQQIRHAPRGWRTFAKAVRSLFGDKLWVEHAVGEGLGYDGPLLFVPHHVAHAASAFLPSPFDEAAILTMDGVGEWSTTTLGVGRGARVELLAEQRFPHSLGLFYSTLTVWCGFKVNSGEYKLMGLAPYGTPRFAEVLEREVIHIGEDGTVVLNLKHFDFPAGTQMGRDSLSALLGGPPRKESDPITEREVDLAASAQAVLEKAVLRMGRHARERTGMRRACLAGGVALNCVAIGKLLSEGVFDEVFVQPAAGDAGGAIGAALLGMQEAERDYRPPRPVGGDAMQAAHLGPRVTEEQIRTALAASGLAFEEHAPERLDDEVCAILEQGGTVGWFQGRMEFGPRALGARSILADPRRPEMRERVNRDVKKREGFRPFAPSVLAERAHEAFDVVGPAPYMTRIAHARGFDGAIRPESKLFTVMGWKVQAPLPSVTHVDGTSRLQTVEREANPRYHQLLTAFHRRTGCPALLNTSFNLRGEPIVALPDDALRTFAHSGLDALALGPFLVRRSAQAADFASRIDAPDTRPD